MQNHFTFSRITKGDSAPNFIYNVNESLDNDWSSRSTAMKDVGAHWSVTIKNYMREDLIMVNSLRTTPQRFASVYAEDELLLEDTNNFVVIEIRFRENERSREKGVKVKSQKKIEIKLPGHILQTKSLFVPELGCYLTIESRLQATQECVAQDAKFPRSKDVSVPESIMKVDAAATLKDYQKLFKTCVERADKIMVKVGVKIKGNPDLIPEHIKSMRIAVMDRDFSPYLCNRMQYDPDLSPEEFSVENLHFVSSQPLYSTWEKLRNAEGRAFFIDTVEHVTLGGVLCGLVICADEDALGDYLFRARATAVYDELTERVIDRSGEHALKKKIEDLETIAKGKDSEIDDLEDRLKTEKDISKEYKRTKTALEQTLKQLRENHDPSIAYETVRSEIEKDKEELRLAWAKLDFEREELKQKAKTTQTAHKAANSKSWADILKSSWSIMVLAGTAVATLIKWGKNLKYFAV